MADTSKKSKPVNPHAQDAKAASRDQAPITSSNSGNKIPKKSLVTVALVGASIAVVIAIAVALWPNISSRMAVKSGYFSTLPTSDGRQTALRTIEEMEEERRSISNQLTATIERVNEIELELNELKNMIKATAPVTDVLEADVALQQIKELFAKIEGGGAGFDNLLKRVDKLEEDRKAAQNGPAADELAASNEQTANAITRLSQRLANLETTAATAINASAQSRAVALAVGQLREAARFDFPFGEPLAALKAMAAGEQELVDGVAALEPYAAKGVPSLALLREHFDQLASRIVSVTRFGGGSGWVHDVLVRAASLFIIRQVDGGADPNSVDGILFNAETSLRTGDLMNAVKTMGKLDGEAAAAAAQWIKDAKDRLAVEKSLASLNVFAVSILDPAKK